MKLTEALRILQVDSSTGQPFDVTLVCGFTPLHAETFLAAHLRLRLPSRSVKIRKGLYDDPIGTLQNTASGNAVAVLLEWADLDPRLGYRSAGAWRADRANDILTSVQAALHRFRGAIESLPTGLPVALSLPTLPLPPLFHTVGRQSSALELALRQSVLTFAVEMNRPGLAIANGDRLALQSPLGSRYDFKADLLTGLPYTIAHIDALCEALAGLLAPAAPKKGIITDLDDTLWYGIVGEIGAENVAWDLTSHRQLHGLYQKLLDAFASEGVLVGIASKNDAAVAGRALAREDLLVRRDSIFPAEIHWQPKSGSVSRILEAWNIGADSVIFVDDSPMELAEVAAAHPGIECIQFPRDDYRGGYEFLQRLRDLFGKPRLSDEDALRLDSIRQGVAFRESAAGGSVDPEDFLRQAEAVVGFDFEAGAGDARALELVNKTNQFNLNGIRLTDGEWKQHIEQPGGWMATVSYQDRFGPLGKIAVVQGRVDGRTLLVETWVMSCRAFARRIEFQTIRTLFDRFEAEAIEFAFTPTAKNGPVGDFARSVTGDTAAGPFRLRRADFEERCPALYHRVQESQVSGRA